MTISSEALAVTLRTSWGLSKMDQVVGTLVGGRIYVVRARVHTAGGRRGALLLEGAGDSSGTSGRSGPDRAVVMTARESLHAASSHRRAAALARASALVASVTAIVTVGPKCLWDKRHDWPGNPKLYDRGVGQ